MNAIRQEGGRQMSARDSLKVALTKMEAEKLIQHLNDKTHKVKH